MSPFKKGSSRKTPELPWRVWYPRFVRNWKQGDHILDVGPTQSGKSLLARKEISQNIATERRAGKSSKQAAAIAYRKAGKSRKKK